MDSTLTNVEKSYIGSGILLDRTFDWIRLSTFNPTIDTINYNLFAQALRQIRLASYNPMEDVSAIIAEQAIFDRTTSQVHVGIFDYDVCSIDTNIIRAHPEYYDTANDMLSVPEGTNIFYTKNIKMAGFLSDLAIADNNGFINVLFDNNNYYTNTSLTIQQILIQPVNGNPLVLNPGVARQIHVTNGMNPFIIQVTLSNGITYSYFSSMKVDAINNGDLSDFEYVDADIGYQGLGESCAH